MKQKYKKFLSLIGLSFFVANLVMVAATPVMIYAQAAPTPPAAPAPSSAVAAGAGEKSIQDYLCTPAVAGSEGTTLYQCINKLYRFSLAAAFFITVLFIVFAGYQYMVGGEKGKEDAKGRISAAVVAIVILSTSFILLRQINPDLVEFKKIDPLPVDFSKGQGDLAKLLPACSENGNVEPCRGRDIPGSDDPDGGAAGAGTNGGTSLDLKDTVCDKDNTKDYSVNCVNLQDEGIACEKARDECWVQKALYEGLKKLNYKTNPAKVYFKINEAWRPTYKHSDGCHATGACVDMGVSGGTFEQLCALFPGTGLSIWNESQKTSSECGPDKFKPGVSSGPHLHVYLGGGGGGGGGSSGGVSGLPGIVPYSGNPGSDGKIKSAHVYPDEDWTDPSNQTTLNQLKAAYEDLRNKQPSKNLSLRQVYRPKEYGDHLRSVWEAYNLAVKKKDFATVAKTGFSCQNNSSPLFLNQSHLEQYSKNPSLLPLVTAEYNTHFPERPNGDAPTTCDPDHAYGRAFDLASGFPQTQDFMAQAIASGLCHNIAGDAPHFTLASAMPAGTKCSQPYTIR